MTRGERRMAAKDVYRATRHKGWVDFWRRGNDPWWTKQTHVILGMQRKLARQKARREARSPA
jgi:hypothetical protein